MMIDLVMRQQLHNNVIGSLTERWRACAACSSDICCGTSVAPRWSPVRPASWPWRWRRPRWRWCSWPTWCAVLCAPSPRASATGIAHSVACSCSWSWRPAAGAWPAPRRARRRRRAPLRRYPGDGATVDALLSDSLTAGLAGKGGPPCLRPGRTKASSTSKPRPAWRVTHPSPEQHHITCCRPRAIDYHLLIGHPRASHQVLDDDGDHGAPPRVHGPAGTERSISDQSEEARSADALWRWWARAPGPGTHPRIVRWRSRPDHSTDLSRGPRDHIPPIEFILKIAAVLVFSRASHAPHAARTAGLVLNDAGSGATPLRPESVDARREWRRREGCLPLRVVFGWSWAGRSGVPAAPGAPADAAPDLKNYPLTRKRKDQTALSD